MAGSTPKTPVQAPRPLELGLRVALSLIVTISLAWLYSKQLASALLPLFAFMLEWLDDHYRIVSLSVASEGADTVVKLQVGLARIIVIGGHVLMPDPRGLATVTTATGTVLQAPLLALATALAWPFKNILEIAFRTALCAMVMALLCVIDTPFCLWAYIWRMHKETFDPGGFSLLLQWQEFLGNGGRVLLGIGGEYTATAAARQIIGRRRNAMTSMPRPLNNKA